jgi:hypothetical protein
MVPKRGHASKTRKASLRFVLIGPKPTSVLKFSDRLLRQETAGKARGPRGEAAHREPPGANLPFTSRIVAALIAAVWIFAGLAATVIGAREGKWLPGLLGPASALYGIAWVRVAYRGRLAGGRLRLNPWRRE